MDFFYHKASYNHNYRLLCLHFIPPKQTFYFSDVTDVQCNAHCERGFGFGYDDKFVHCRFLLFYDNMLWERILHFITFNSTPFPLKETTAPPCLIQFRGKVIMCPLSNNRRNFILQYFLSQFTVPIDIRLTRTKQ